VPGGVKDVGSLNTKASRFVDPVTETMTEAEIAQLQLRRLNEFLDSSVWPNRYFRARAGYGPPRTLGSIQELKDLPLMRKADVMTDIADHPPFGSRCNAAPEEVRQIVETSGTSGAGRERYPLTDHDLDLIQQMEMPGFGWAGIEPGKVFVSSLPVTTRAGGQWYQDAVRRLQGIWLSVGTYPAEEKLRYMREIGADVIHASPSYLLRLEAVAAQLSIDPRSLNVGAIMSSGESLSVPWLEEREEIWGAKIHEQYGSTQRAIAWTCEAGARRGQQLGVLHTLPHLAVYEVIDPQTGEEVPDGGVGELVITPFGSTAAPIVRFASGDRVRKVAAAECGCGRPYPGLRSGSIDRFDAMLKIRGVNIVPSAVDSVVMRDPVTDYQARVYRDGQSGKEEIEVLVATTAGAPDPALLSALTEDFRRVVGLRATFVPHDKPSIVEDTKVDVKKRKRWTDERSAAVAAPGRS
jgi:phenylacetate-CoA ligase